MFIQTFFLEKHYVKLEETFSLLFWQLEPDGTLIWGQIIWIRKQKLSYQPVFDQFKTAVNCGWTKDLNNGSTTQIFSFISVIILYNFLTGIVSWMKELHPRNYINIQALFCWNYRSFGDSECILKVCTCNHKKMVIFQPSM